jgi:hypothetical protein
MEYINMLTGKRRHMSHMQKILAGPHWVLPSEIECE